MTQAESKEDSEQSLCKETDVYALGMVSTAGAFGTDLLNSHWLYRVDNAGRRFSVQQFPVITNRILRNC